MRFLFLFIFLLFLSLPVQAKKVIKVYSVQPFSAKSYLIADEDGTIIKELNGKSIRPIASISKLMVALLTVKQDLFELISIPETRSVSSSIPKSTILMTRRELLILSLVKSDNFAAQILCENLPNCVEKMNEEAVVLGMSNTKFYEPTGLNKGNVSTAQDLLKLLIVASTDETLTELSSLPEAEILIDDKIIHIRNTNPLVSKFDVVLSKTGFTTVAGGCMVMIVNSSIGRRILVLLGSKNVKTRVVDMEKLIKNA